MAKYPPSVFRCCWMRNHGTLFFLFFPTNLAFPPFVINFKSTSTISMSMSITMSYASALCIADLYGEADETLVLSYKWFEITYWRETGQYHYLFKSPSSGYKPSKNTILLLFTHPHIIPNLYDLKFVWLKFRNNVNVSKDFTYCY